MSGDWEARVVVVLVVVLHLRLWASHFIVVWDGVGWWVASCVVAGLRGQEWAPICGPFQKWGCRVKKAISKLAPVFFV